MFTSGKEEVPISYRGMDPLRLFCERSKCCKFWQFIKLGDMVPLNLLSYKLILNN